MRGRQSAAMMSMLGLEHGFVVPSNELASRVTGLLDASAADDARPRIRAGLGSLTNDDGALAVLQGEVMAALSAAPPEPADAR